MTRPDLPVAGPLHAWLVDAGDLLGVALLVAALLSLVAWYAVRDLRTEATDRAAATIPEGSAWFWDITEPAANEPPAGAAPAEAPAPAARASAGGGRRPKPRTKVA